MEGHYADARRRHERALPILEEVLGPKHPDVATSLNNLANSMSWRGTTPTPAGVMSARLRFDVKSSDRTTGKHKKCTCSSILLLSH